MKTPHGTAIRYDGVIKQLADAIRDGSLAAGDRLPTFTALQAQFGTTSNTINRAMMELEKAGLVTREKGRGVFVADRKTARKHAIGLVGFNSSSTSSPYYALLMQGIERVARREQFEMTLLDPDSTRGLEKVDGVLVHGEYASAYFARLVPSTPRVAVMSTTADTISVGIDDFNAAYLAVEHLVELGHRRIGFLGHKSSLVTRRRRAGYEAALEAHRIDLDPRWARHYAPTPVERLASQTADTRTLELGKEGGRQWLADDWSELGLTAVLLQSDELAIGLIKSLQEAGLKVPEDVSVVGFDSTDLCEMCSPRLTSVRLPLTQIGAAATELLMCQIREESLGVVSSLLPVQLDLRDSTARVALRAGNPAH